MVFWYTQITVSRYIITSMNFIHLSLGSIAVWPFRQQVDQSTPTTFKKTCPNTLCIIDCTELFNIQRFIFSDFINIKKHNFTVWYETPVRNYVKQKWQLCDMLGMNYQLNLILLSSSILVYSIQSQVPGSEIDPKSMYDKF